MATVMTNTEFVKKLKEAATNYKTLYVMGCFGAPMNTSNKKRYTNNHEYNRDPKRTAMINAASADTFGFDCVCLIKGILWGWKGDKTKTYGGAGYAVNGVPDIGADSMIKVCSGVSTDFSKLVPGEAVWMEGHIGVYVGDGLAVECTPKWENKVQITACNCSKSGYNRRNWTKHGKLPYIDYVAADTPVAPPAPATEKKSVEEIAKEVINGLWGNGEERKQKLTAAGYDYSTVQAKVNEMLAPKPATKPSKSIDDLAKEVINGDWGNGADRKNRLTAAGYDYAKVQARVNELCAAATPKPAEVYVPKKGDIVNFKGNKHYSNANATSGYYCKPGKAKITQDPCKVGKSKHPYHLVAVSGGGSNVYGWVDAGTFEKA